MISERLRGLLSGVMQGVGTTLARTGLSPNVFTVIGFTAVVINAVVIALGFPQLAGLLLIVALALDSLDGAVARATGRISAFGAFLDSTLDRWAEVAIFFGMAVYLQGSWIDQAIIYWAICSSLLVSYTRARAEGIGVQCKEGFFTRFERVVVIIIGLLSLQMTIANAVIAVLATFTAVQRVWYVWGQTRGR
ncbi:MAG: CDP-alcohol phosphatidyltransferase family protein [Chloroflexi bacterium]|nr:CDP-alcohol phosphatidyltransferase family protein [Chloroflexota bacterium]